MGLFDFIARVCKRPFHTKGKGERRPWRHLEMMGGNVLGWIMDFYKYVCVGLLVAGLGFPLRAQDSGTEDSGDGAEYEDEGKINSDLPIQSNWLGEEYSLYSSGDKIFSITLGILFPLFFTDSNYNTIPNKLSAVGGTGALSYFYFINPHIFFGGELQGAFSQTIGENFLFLVPMNLRAGYQFLWKRFEFPVSLGIGGITHSYRERNLYGFFMKGEGSAFFRLNADWSFGMNVAFWWTPEWGTQNPDTKVKTPEYNAYGHFFELTASARYHF
jgi:hypothetical protein